MVDSSEFEDIRPYDETEVIQAIDRLSRHPGLPLVSKYLYPKESSLMLSKLLKTVHSTDDLQNLVMLRVIAQVLGKTSEGFTYEGAENLASLKGKKFLAISNHRDIVLDPALIQYALHESGVAYTEICVGNNLLSSQWVEDIMRSNRMIKVIRGISARELYLSSQILSKYIRTSITGGNASIWIAQREGRTKDGNDTTEQGLLKMFDMSGEKGFLENFDELNIIPMSISYEYESCDFRKAREILVKRTEGSYKKKKNEDLHSIMTGIRQQKGHIHLTIGAPLTREEISAASEWKGNDRYQAIRHILDERIIGGFKLFKTNYMAWDILHGSEKYLGVKYLPDDLKAFKTYVNHKISRAESGMDKAALKNIFLEIYATPVDNKNVL